MIRKLSNKVVMKFKDLNKLYKTLRDYKLLVKELKADIVYYKEQNNKMNKFLDEMKLLTEYNKRG